MNFLICFKNSQFTKPSRKIIPLSLEIAVPIGILLEESHLDDYYGNHRIRYTLRSFYLIYIVKLKQFQLKQ